MRIVQPHFSLRTPSGDLTEEKGIELLRFIEWNARISHRSEEAQTEDSWKRFIKSVCIDRADWSVAEHASVTAVLTVDRGVSHQLVRHRHFSYTQESTRFVNYKKIGEISVIRPEGLEVKDDSPWLESVAKSCWAYTVMMERGANPQMARSVLPNALATKISVTGNLRNWRHLFLTRTSRETQADFRAITIPMLTHFQRMIPILYDDVQPNSRQIENLSKAR